jgi:hypothetical protein
MSEPKTVVWFGDDPKPNTFFFRSPFRSWKFLVCTALLVSVCALFISLASRVSSSGAMSLFLHPTPMERSIFHGCQSERCASRPMSANGLTLPGKRQFNT